MAKEPEIIAEDLYLDDLEIDQSIKDRSIYFRQNMSTFEKKIWDLVGKEGNRWDLLRQIPMGGYYLDFYSPTSMACVEADGPDHIKTKEHDYARDIELGKQGIRTLRITPADFRRGRPLDILEMISNFLESDD